MQRVELIKLFLEHNFNISADALEYLEQNEISEEIIRKRIKNIPRNVPVINLDILKEFIVSNDQLDENKKLKIEKTTFPPSHQISLSNNELEEKITIEQNKIFELEAVKPTTTFIHKVPSIKISLEIPDRTPEITDIEAFRIMFQNRFRELSRILVENLENPERLLKRKLTLNEIPKNRSGIIIGMVQDTRVLHTNRFVIQLEDPVTEINTNCVIVQDSLTFPEYRNILRDTVCGIDGILPKNYREGEITAFWGKDIIRPSFKPITFNETAEPYNILFLSDIHYGSKYFTNSLFSRLIKLLNSEFPDSKYHHILSKIDIIVIAGDLTDGVGRFPNQKNSLTNYSLQTQYEGLAKRISEVPSHIKIIIIPGEHDATITALPQTPIDKNIAISLLKIPNIQSYGNPLQFSVDNIDFLIFHGQGNDFSYQKDIEPKYSRPISIIQNILEYRHLSPEYGSKIPLLPFKKDYLVIDKIPNVIIAGHYHQADFQEYKGVKIATCGSFLREKSEKENLVDTTSLGVFPILNTATGKITMLDLQNI